MAGLLAANSNPLPRRINLHPAHRNAMRARDISVHLIITERADNGVHTRGDQKVVGRRDGRDRLLVIVVEAGLGVRVVSLVDADEAVAAG